MTTKQELYERKVTLKIAEMVFKDAAREGMGQAYKELGDAITSLSPDARMYWYQNHYLPSKQQKEIQGEDHAEFQSLLAEVKSNGGQNE
jgi:hypothetical protein